MLLILSNNYLLLILLMLLSLSSKLINGFIKQQSNNRLLTSLSAGKIKIEDILKNPQWPDKWPFQPRDFSRQDETIDTNFYNQPRLVYHIDDGAVNALTKYYKETIKPNSKILDICSSWYILYYIILTIIIIIIKGITLSKGYEI